MTEFSHNGGPPPLRRVAITGIGCITPIGTGVEALWKGLRRRESAVQRIDRFDPSPFRSHIAAQVNEFEPTDYMDRNRARRTERYAQFSIASARLALADATLDPASVDPDRAGVLIGSALGGVAYGENQFTSYVHKGVRGVDPMLALAVFNGASSCNVAIEFGFTGPNSTNAMSCASGTVPAPAVPQPLVQRVIGVWRTEGTGAIVRRAIGRVFGRQRRPSA